MSNNNSQDDREVIGGMYWDDAQERLIQAPPTEDLLSIGLRGLFYQIAWISISEARFQELAANATGRDEFKDIIWMSVSADGQTFGREYGMRAGGGNLEFSKYEAHKYLDLDYGITKVIKFSYQDIPIKETLSVNEGQYILFSIDEAVNSRRIDIDDGVFDESKLNLFIERFRFGEIYFDMLRMEYAEQQIEKDPYPIIPHGSLPFILDPSGTIHHVFVHDDDD